MTSRRDRRYTSRRERILLAAVPVLVLAVYPDARDVFQAVKVWLLVGLAVLLVALRVVELRLAELWWGTMRWVDRPATAATRPRPLRPPVPLVAVGSALLVGLLWGWLTSPDRTLSLWGLPGRYGGLLTYLCLLVLGATSCSLAERSIGRRLLAVLSGTGAALALVVLGERAGFWGLADGPAGAVGTIGNGNFTSAMLALCVTASCAAAADARGTVRRLHIGIAAIGVVAVLLAGALQGGVVLGVTGTALGLIAALRLRRERRRRAVVGTVVVALLAAIVLGLGLADIGPAARLSGPGTVVRLVLWRTAVTTAAEDPITGVGLDRFGVVWRDDLPDAYVDDFPLGRVVDRAHNVPLQLAAGGGLPLLAAYLLLVGTTAVAAVRLLRDPDWVTAGVIAVWLGYQAQSLISLDLVPMAAVHAITAGWLLGRRWPRRPPTDIAARTDRPRRGRTMAPALVVTVVVTAAALVLASAPLRAEVSALEAATAIRAGDLDRALVETDRATSAMPWEPSWQHLLGVALRDGGRFAEASVALQAADDRPGGYLPAAIVMARLAYLDLRDLDLARRWYDRAAEIEPRHPDLRLEIARFALVTGDLDRAQAELDTARRFRPDDPAIVDLQQRLDRRTGG